MFGAGETVRVIPVQDGVQETACVLTQASLSAPIPRGSIPVLEMDLPDWVDAGSPYGRRLGEARLVLDGNVIASVPLLLGETLAKRDYAYELDRVVRNWPSVPQAIAK